MAAPMSSTTSNLVKNGFLPIKQTVFLLCDLQERFRSSISHFDAIVQSSIRLVKVSKILGIPLIVTEQNPSALGSTVPEIDKSHAVATYPKTKFSMCIPEVEKQLVQLKDLSSVVLFGIEAHACIEQTAIELRAKNLSVHIVGDAVSSRSMEDRLLALERMKQIGCFVTTTETVVFKLLTDKNHPQFNQIRSLVKEMTIPTGLARL